MEDDDWELLHHHSTPIAIAHNNMNGEFSNAIIRSDYFSIHHHTYQAQDQGGYVTEEGSSVHSHHPTLMPIPYPINDDSATHTSDDPKFDANTRLPTVEKSDSQNSSDESGEEKEAREVKNVEIEAPKSAGFEEEKKTPVWWKLPLKYYCVFRGSPVWSISVAAAVMGFLILGRRLYKMMKKKPRSLPLKVTLDDKKVSQFMTRAAHLNEEFSVVKRVQVIRSSLPAAGVTHWSMMSLR